MMTVFNNRAVGAKARAGGLLARGRGRAFSVVELLVVLAIIGIVAALLFPVFVRARQRSGNERCVSNLHQIYLATQLYLQDYDHTYPFAITEGMRKAYSTDPPSKWLLSQPFGKYVAVLPNVQTVLDRYDGRTRDIFHCPYDTNKKLAWLQITNFARYGLSYHYNDTLGLNSTTDAQIENPAIHELADDVLAGWHTPEVEPADDDEQKIGQCAVRRWALQSALLSGR